MAPSMKVLNLRCTHGHLFEGWFSSEDDFLDQNGRGLIDCPLCTDKVITRMPSAPRLNLSNTRHVIPPQPVAATAPAPSPAPAAAPELKVTPENVELQAMYLQAVKQVMARTEDVGERFPEEARRIHYGESKHRGIRGQASPEERATLADEGIDVVPLPVPPGWKGSAH